MKNFKLVELIIVFLAAIIILVSEYYYLIADDVDKAIFIGLWPPTILIFLMYINSKKNKNDK